MCCSSLALFFSTATELLVPKPSKGNIVEGISHIITYLHGCTLSFMIATDETYYLERKAERTCEILADLADDTLPVNQSIMYLKITSTSAGNIKGLEYNLSRLCGMDLHLLDCELGDINNVQILQGVKYNQY